MLPMTDYHNQLLSVGDKAQIVSYMANSVTRANVGKVGVITRIVRTRVLLAINHKGTEKTLAVVPENLIKLI